MKRNEREFDFKDNAFDILRIISAVLIMIGHASDFLGVALPSSVRFAVGAWRGLPCLFVISGYLISASYDRSQSNFEYIRKRVIRLYPGLLCAFFISALCILFIGGGYLGQVYPIHDIVKWTFSQVTVFQFYTPDSLRQYGVGNPNGALWTISLEIQMYILIMLILPKVKKMSLKMQMSLIMLFWGINIIFPFTQKILPTILYKLLNVTFVPYAYYFIIGIVAYTQKEKWIPKLVQMFWPMLIGYIFWKLFNIGFPLHIGYYTDCVSGPWICLLSLSGAYYFGGHYLKHDFSYSIYLYHMIVVNVFVAMGWSENYLMLGATVLVTVITSVFSCFCVEEPTIRKYNTVRIERK